MKVYYYLHYAIKAYIESRELLILYELTILRGGYNIVISRNRALSNIIQESYTFI